MKFMRSDMASHGSHLQSDMTTRATKIQRNHAEAKTAISSVIATLTTWLDADKRAAKEDLATTTDRVGLVDNALQQHVVRVNAVELQLEAVISSHTSFKKTTTTTVAAPKKSMAPDQRDKKFKALAFEAVKKESA